MRITPIISSLAIAAALLPTLSAHAAPVAASGYNIGLFAAGLAGTSAADRCLSSATTSTSATERRQSGRKRRRGQHHCGVQPPWPTPGHDNRDRAQRRTSL